MNFQALYGLVRTLAWRDLRQRPLRTAISVLSVASGVALYVSISIINDSVQAYFAQAVGAMVGSASLIVTAEGGGLREADLPRLRAISGVADAVPVVVVPVMSLGPGTWTSPWVTLVGIDPERESIVRSYKFARTGGAATTLDVLRATDAILVGEHVAASRRLHIGGEFVAMTLFGPHVFRVSGIVSPLGPGLAHGGDIGLVSIPTAQDIMMSTKGRYSRIDVVTAPGSDPEVVRQRAESQLGPGVHVERPEAQIEQLKRTVRAYQELLVLLSALALVVGVLVLASSLSLTLLERRREFGTLRALGATRTQVLMIIEAEAVLIALAGACLGVMAGRLLATLLVGSISRAIENQYLTPISVHALAYANSTAFVHIGMATAVAALGALIVAYRGTHVAPIDAVRYHNESDDQSGARIARSGAVGVLLLGALVLALAFGVHRGHPAVQATFVGLALLSSILAAPWLTIKALNLLYPLWIRNDVTDRRGVLYVAALGIVRLPGRTGSNTLSLIVGLLLIVSAATLQNSFAHSMGDWLDRILSADLIIASPGRLFMMDVEPVHESMRTYIAGIPGVAARDATDVAGMRFVHHRYGGTMIGIKAFDRPVPSQRGLPFDVHVLAPTAREDDLFRRERPTALVSDTFAQRFGKHAGQILRLQSPNGPVDFEIIGEMVDYASPEGVIYLSRDVYKRFWNDPLVTAFSLMVQSGASVVAVADRINKSLGPSHGLYASSNRELHAQLSEILTESFAYTYAIEGAALLVGLLGLFHTTLASVIARTREMGVLRALGMSRAALRWMVVAEALLQSVFGAWVAIACGLFVAYVGLTGAMSTIMGRTVAFRPPWQMLLSVTGIGIAVGVLASAIPAARSARIEIAEALSYE